MGNLFIDRIYEETLRLLEDARDYMMHWERRDRYALAMEARPLLAHESMRMTARLTSVMSWLLVQRAVDAGEITVYEALTEDYRLLVTSVHTTPLPSACEVLPARLCRARSAFLAPGSPVSGDPS